MILRWVTQGHHGPLVIDFSQKVRRFMNKYAKFGQMFTSERHVQHPWPKHADSVFRSQLEVLGLSLQFHVLSISPLPLEGFSLNFGQKFTLDNWCAEHIIQPCRLKVIMSLLKVTSLSLEFRVWSISPLPWEWYSLNFGQMFPFMGKRIFIKFWSNCWLSVTMCRSHG